MCLVTPDEGKLISQETLQTIFQLHTPMSIKEPTKHPVTWPTLSQPFITPISTSVQLKRSFYNGTTDWATWASREFNFLWELECLLTLKQPKVFTPLHASLLPTPFVQHVRLANRDKGHLQAREAQWSRMFKAT